VRVGKWVARGVGLGLVALLAYPQLSRINWGYHEESGQMMAGTVGDPFQSKGKEQANALASEVCGGAVIFDRQDKSTRWVAMPEQAKAEHFFINSKFSDIIWLGVGNKDRFCLARYRLTMKDEGYVDPWPLQLFPPVFAWFPRPVTVENRFIDRFTGRPKAPDGVRALFPGECVNGEIVKGESLRFQVEMPHLGQKVEFLCDWDHRDGPPLASEWRRNGQVLTGEYDEPGGGTYEVTLRAPTTEAKRFRMSLYWGWEGVCLCPDGWIY